MFLILPSGLQVEKVQIPSFRTVAADQLFPNNNPKEMRLT